MLGSYFLKERLGTLGKLGCALCLLGSVVIVLHAPPDKPVERIDEILAYAVKPGPPFITRSPVVDVAYTVSRVPILLPCRGDLLYGHDLPRRASIRKEKPSHLHLDLLHCRLDLGHVGQGIRYRGETDPRWQ